MNPTEIYEVIENSIRHSQVIEVDYLDGRNEVYTIITEPYLIFENKDGFLYCHSYQTGGEYRHRKPPHWANLNLAKITDIRWTSKNYIAPLQGYNPRSIQFSKVLFQWEYKP